MLPGPSHVFADVEGQEVVGAFLDFKGALKNVHVGLSVPLSAVYYFVLGLHELVFRPP
jgi:hypothetical protein